jgi:Uma2 family endonuclease
MPYHLSAEVFLRMVETEILPRDRRVYLWDGVLYEKMAKKIAHAVTSETARLALSSAIPVGWSLWGENPILVDDFTAPLPDLTVVRGQARDYFSRNAVPKASDIGLVIEIADATLGKNLNASLTRYAAAGLPTYWLVNLITCRIEVYSAPAGPVGSATYTSRDEFALGQEIPLVLDGLVVSRIPVSAMLPSTNPR